MSFLTEGLNPDQVKCLRLMGARMAERQFYLAGGTALAIYFAHRRSLDLDWFTGLQIRDPMYLAQELRDLGLPFVTDQTAPGTLHGKIGETRVSLLEYHYSMLRPLVHWQEMELNLADLDDLACMKLSAIAQRGSRKDFYDAHALITRYRPLSELLQLYREKFQVSDISPVLYGLVYFDDAESEPVPSLLWKSNWRSVKREIRLWVKDLTR
jgi:predicted nucleotidyltransferase component of viral defense system